MRSRRAFLATLGGSIGVLAGCGYRPGGGDYRWTAKTEADMFGPLNGRFIAADWVDMTAYDVESGHKIATTWVDRELDNGIETYTFGDDTFVLGSEQWIRLYDSIDQYWEVPLDSFAEDVATAGGWAYALTYDERIVGAANGSRQWEIESEEFRDGNILANDNAVVFFTDKTNGIPHGFAPDGSLRWRRSLDLWGLTDEYARPWLIDDDLLVLQEGNLIVINARTGEKRWEKRDREFDVATATDDTLYCIEGNDLIAYDRSGSRRWRTEVLSSMQTPHFYKLIADKRGIFATASDDSKDSPKETLVCVDPNDSRIRWKVRQDDSSRGPFLFENGVVVASDREIICHYRE